MKAFFYTVAFALAAASVAHAQSLAVTRTSNELGFSFTMPGDWEVMDTSAAAKEQARQDAKNEQDKKGLACAEIGLTGRHGNPPSAITEVALPFDCYGQQLPEDQLPGFASSSSAGLEQNFDLAEPVYGGYQLGTHHFWIERVQGAVKGHADLKYTIEIACSVTKKAAVCWMTMASDDAALAIFEHMPVSLDGDAAAGLVPANAFETKPS